MAGALPAPHPSDSGSGASLASLSAWITALACWNWVASRRQAQPDHPVLGGQHCRPTVGRACHACPGGAGRRDRPDRDRVARRVATGGQMAARWARTPRRTRRRRGHRHAACRDGYHGQPSTGDTTSCAQPALIKTTPLTHPAHRDVPRMARQSLPLDGGIGV